MVFWFTMLIIKSLAWNSVNVWLFQLCFIPRGIKKLLSGVFGGDTGCTVVDKVLIYKSRGGLSLLVQLTIHCVFLAYFDTIKYTLEKKYTFLTSMSIKFLVLFCICFPGEKYFFSKISETFSTASRPKTSPNIKLNLIKIASRDLYTMTLTAECRPVVLVKP